MSHTATMNLYRRRGWDFGNKLSPPFVLIAWTDECAWDVVGVSVGSVRLDEHPPCSPASHSARVGPHVRRTLIASEASILINAREWLRVKRLHFAGTNKYKVYARSMPSKLVLRSLNPSYTSHIFMKTSETC